jgi:hypothetical protein
MNRHRRIYLKPEWLSYPTDLHVRFDERGVKTGTTGDLVRRRQTKGTATNMVDLKPPASHSDSTNVDAGTALIEQNNKP